MTVLNITDISNETQLIAVSNRSVTQNAKTIPVTRGRPFKSNVKGTRQTPLVEITTQRKNLSEIVETTETSISATPGVIPITVTETIGFTIGSDMTTVSSNPNDLENDLENEMSLLIRIFSTLNSYWRTSLAIVCNLVLLFFLISYRLKIKKLKARLAERNFRTPSLGNTNSTGSFQRSSNAYTPTNYIQEVPSKLNAASADNNDYQLSSKSRSIYYTGVVNSSLHSYESIRENIYSEIYVEPDLHLYISDSLPRTGMQFELKTKNCCHCFSFSFICRWPCHAVDLYLIASCLLRKISTKGTLEETTSPVLQIYLNEKKVKRTFFNLESAYYCRQFTLHL